MKRKYYFSFENVAHAIGNYSQPDRKSLCLLVEEQYSLDQVNFSHPSDVLVTSKLHKNLPVKDDGSNGAGAAVKEKYEKIHEFIERGKGAFPYDVDAVLESANFLFHFFDDKEKRRQAVSLLKKYAKRRFTCYSVFCREYAIVKSMLVPVGIDLRMNGGSNGFAEIMEVRELFFKAHRLNGGDIKTISAFLGFITKHYIMHFFRVVSEDVAECELVWNEYVKCIVANCKILLAPYIKNTLCRDVYPDDAFRYLHDGMHCTFKCNNLSCRDGRLHSSFSHFVDAMAFAMELIERGESLNISSSEFCCAIGVLVSFVSELVCFMTLKSENNVANKKFIDILRKTATKIFERGTEIFRNDSVLNMHFSAHLFKCGNGKRATKYLNRAEGPLMSVPILRQELLMYHYLSLIYTCDGRKRDMCRHVAAIYALWASGVRVRKTDLMFHTARASEFVTIDDESVVRLSHVISYYPEDMIYFRDNNDVNKFFFDKETSQEVFVSTIFPELRCEPAAQSG